MHIRGSILHNLPRNVDMTEQEPLVFALIVLFIEGGEGPVFENGISRFFYNCLLSIVNR